MTLALTQDVGLLDGGIVQSLSEVGVGGHAKAGKEFAESRDVIVREEDFEQGQVKFVHKDGYGFITRDGKKDVYFHVARLPVDVANQIEEGVDVLVAVGESKRGPSALMVKIA